MRSPHTANREQPSLTPTTESPCPATETQHNQKIVKIKKEGEHLTLEQFRQNSIPKVSRSVQFSRSVVSDSLRPHGLQHARPPCPPETPEGCSHSLSIKGDAIQPSHPLSSSSPPAFNPSIRVFFSESALCIRWTEYWSFSFSISPSKVISPKVSDYDLFSFLLPGSENKLWKLTFLEASSLSLTTKLQIVMQVYLKRQWLRIFNN